MRIKRRKRSETADCNFIAATHDEGSDSDSDSGTDVVSSSEEEEEESTDPPQAPLLAALIDKPLQRDNDNSELNKLEAEERKQQRALSKLVSYRIINN
eukprot:SAG11_NODE_5196_length_1633_cov_2.139505_2_plen_98_part_00